MSLAYSLEAMSEESNSQSVRALMEDCESEQPVNRFYCLGYVAGILHGFGIRIVDESDETISEPMFCPSEFVSANQATQIFINWAEQHPEQWNEDNWIGVVNALGEVYPCESE
jgi:hypothetical protein